MTKRLSELVRGMPCTIHGNPEVEIKSIAYHSARAKPGSLFVAIDGFRVSGSRFIDEAMNRGAVAVATTELNRVRRGWVNIVLTPTPRKFLAQVASRFYDFPSRKLSLVGVTGTNGKTTTTYIVRAMARQMGIEPGFIGTIEYFDGAQQSAAGQTTPESLDFTEMLSRMVEAKAPVCIAEVSSHALALDRVIDQDFKVGAFTNLSQDHLDFHKTIRAYQEAKLKLFEQLSPTSYAVTNQDDALGREIPGKTRARVIRYGARPDLEPAPDITGRVVRSGPDGLETELVCRGKTVPVRLKLAGRYNLGNLMAAFGIGTALGWPLEEMAAGAASLGCVPGRLESVATDRGFRVFVDFAHTPDGLRHALETAREFTTGRVIVVFGCGGDRDRAKRPLMGKAVAERADMAVVTSDNPRSEAPEAIIAEIVAGMNSAEKLVIPDRREAIAKALELAQDGDTVLVAGKGHEPYQIVGSERRPFDDVAVCRELLEEMAAGSSRKAEAEGRNGEGGGRKTCS